MTEFLQTAKENLSFLLICLLVFAGLVLVAWLAQHFLVPDRRQISPARRVSYVAMFSAVAAVLHIIDFPLFFAPSFYKIDFSEISVLICAFYLGPVSGVVCELLKIILKLLIKGTSTDFVGDFANFFVGCSMVLPAAIIYHCKKSKKSALIGLAVGTAVMTVFGSAFNAFYLIPKFSQLFHMPLDAIVSMGTAINPGITSVSTLVLFAVVPFNIVKGVIVSIVTLLLYKRVERLLRM